MFRVAKLLLAKLGDFVLPSVDSGSDEELEDDAEELDESESSEKSGDMMCLYLHKRDDQPAHEVVQKVLRYDVKISCLFYLCSCFTSLGAFVPHVTLIQPQSLFQPF